MTKYKHLYELPNSKPVSIRLPETLNGHILNCCDRVGQTRNAWIIRQLWNAVDGSLK